MITLLIVLASLTGYYWLGLRLVARPHIVREVEKEAERIAELPRLYNGPKKAQALADQRRTAAGEGLLLALLWPLVLAVRAAMGRLAATTPLSDVEAQQEIRQRDHRIAELERELGIKR